MKKIYIIILLLSFLFVSNVNAQSYQYGFAHGALSKRPNLWKGLVGCWKFSLGVTGTKTIYDISGNGNHGTINGAMTIDDWVLSNNPRNPGYTLDFDGVDDQINISDATTLDGMAQVSVSAWVKSNDFTASGQVGVVGKGNWNTAYSLYLREFNTGNVGIAFAINGTSLQKSSVDDNWHFLTGTYDGSNIRLYKDSIEIDSTAKTGTVQDNINDVTIGYVGAIGGDPDNFTGLIDDVRIYNRALSPGEILDIYQHPNAMFEFNEVMLAKPPTAPPITPPRIQSIIISKAFQKYFNGFAFVYTNINNLQGEQQ